MALVKEIDRLAAELAEAHTHAEFLEGELATSIEESRLFKSWIGKRGPHLTLMSYGELEMSPTVGEYR